MINHDEGKVGAWAVREYRCRACGEIHRYKRTLGAIPDRCSICDGLLIRCWVAPIIQVKTEIREVRYKLEAERLRGDRPRAIEEREHHLCTL